MGPFICPSANSDFLLNRNRALETEIKAFARISDDGLYCEGHQKGMVGRRESSFKVIRIIMVNSTQSMYVIHDSLRVFADTFYLESCLSSIYVMLNLYH